jgi:hypothetical protein
MSNTINVPELEPVFSFRTSGKGDVYVYLVKSEIAKFAIMTFDNTISEFAYAVETLTSNTKFEAEQLVHNAKERYQYIDDNPFLELEEDKEAMAKLAAILAEFFSGGE